MKIINSFFKSSLTLLFILALVQPKAFSQDKVFPEDSWGVYSWTRFTQVDRNSAPLIKGGPIIERWANLEPQNGVYKFNTKIDPLLQKALDNNFYCFINIWVAGPAQSGFTPEWIYDQGIPAVQCERGKFPYYFHNYEPGQPPTAGSYQYYYFRLINALAQHLLSLPKDLRDRVVFIQCAEGSTGDGYCYKGDLQSGYTQYDISRADWNVFRLDAWKEFKAAYSVDGKLQIPLLTNDDANNVELRQWMLAELDAIGVKQGMFSHGYQISDAQERVAAHKEFKQQAEAAGKVFFARGEMDGELHEFGWITQNKTQGLYWSAIYATHCGLNHWNVPQNDVKLSIHNDALNFFNKYATHLNPGPADYAFCAFYRGLDASDTQEFPVSQYGPASKSNEQRYVSICNAYSQYGAGMADPYAATGGGMKNRSATGYNDAGWQILKTNFQRHITQIDAEETSAAWWQVDASIYGRFARGFEPSSNKDTMYFDIDDNFFPDNQTEEKSNIKLKVIYRDADPGSWSLKYHAADGSMKTAFSVTNSGSGWKSKEILIEDALLNNGGNRGADLILQNEGGTNCRFHLIELAITGPPAAVEGVSIQSNSGSNLTVGSKLQLEAIVSPDNAGNKDVTWTSLNPGIATVDSMGLVTAVAIGSATIEVTTVEGGFTATRNIEVREAGLEFVTITSPAENDDFFLGQDVKVTAEGYDIDGIERMRFRVDGGEYNSVLEPPYEYEFTNLSIGTHSLEVQMKDNLLPIPGRILSAPVIIKVIPAPSSDATLSDLSVDGTTVSDFASDKVVYDIELDEASLPAPTVTATGTDENADIKVTNAEGLPGTTTVLVTAEDGITGKTYTINFTVADSTVSINNLNGSNKEFVRIYPNPVSQLLNLRFQDSAITKKISIYNTLGQLLYSNQTNNSNLEIDVNALSTQGIIMIRVDSNGIVSYHKVIINQSGHTK